MPVWTLSQRFAGLDEDAPYVGGPDASRRVFLCLRCAGLLYESAERRSSPGVKMDGSRKRVDAMDRFVKRISGGVLHARSLMELPSD